MTNDTNLDSTLTQRAGSVCLAATNLLWIRDVFNALDVNVINLSKSSLDCLIWHPPAALDSNVSNKQRSTVALVCLGFHDKTQSWWVVLPWSSHQIHIHSSSESKVWTSSCICLGWNNLTVFNHCISSTNSWFVTSCKLTNLLTQWTTWSTPFKNLIFYMYIKISINDIF